MPSGPSPPKEEVGLEGLEVEEEGLQMEEVEEEGLEVEEVEPLLSPMEGEERKSSELDLRRRPAREDRVDPR